MKCPVCKAALSGATNSCPICGFNDIRAEFISADEAVSWMDEIVIPYRTNWISNKSSQASDVYKSLLTSAIDSSNTINCHSTECPFEYEYIDDGIILTSYTGYCSESTIVIPDYIEGKPVICLSSSLFENCSWLSHVSLPKFLQRIGADAFKETAISNVVFPDSLDYIGKRAFYNTKLKKALFPDGLNFIGDGAFFQNPLEEVYIPESVEYIGKRAFSNTNIKEIKFPHNLKNISNEICSECRKLEYVDIAEVETIGNFAFRNCKLKNIVIPNSCIKIGTGAFARCPLESVNFLSEYTNLDNEVFAYTTIQEIILPKSSMLKNRLFYKCQKLKTVVITGAPLIKAGVFEGCNLEHLVLPENLEALEEGSFIGCGDIPLLLPASLKTISFDYIINHSIAFINDQISISLGSTNKASYHGVFYCNPGSTAQQFARKHNIAAKPLHEFPIE